jgi:hypothetical protein
MLNSDTIEKLEATGLTLLGKEKDVLIIIKPIDLKGNCIDGDEKEPIVQMELVDDQLVVKKDQIKSNAPSLRVFTMNNTIRVVVWQWVPGPGPGDFSIEVPSEQEAYKVVVNYFFEKNVHFDAYLKWRLENQD